MNFTDLEILMLNSVARNCFQPVNYDIPTKYEETSMIWTNCLDDSRFVVPAKSRPGVMSSLVKKGLMKCEVPGPEQCCRLTEEGFNAYRANMLPEPVKE